MHLVYSYHQKLIRNNQCKVAECESKLNELAVLRVNVHLEYIKGGGKLS